MSNPSSCCHKIATNVVFFAHSMIEMGSKMQFFADDERADKWVRHIPFCCMMIRPLLNFE